MRKRKKRNIIIYSLCGVLLLMVVGYSVFSTQLNINGTTSITSNWDIKITGIKENAKVGASSDGEPTFKDLSATFNVNLVSPGDYITYDVTIENQGTINAELNKIILPQLNNKAILITTSGIKVGDELKASSSVILTVKVEYNPDVTSQPKDTTSAFEMTLDYVEAGKAGSSSTTGTITMGGQTVPVINDGSDGLYADEYEPNRYIYKGSDPDNYITFNGEEAYWRIISVETDGTIKIMRNRAINRRAFDSLFARSGGYCMTCYASQTGCSAWATTLDFHGAGTVSGCSGEVTSDSEIKKYLNETYYDSITKNSTAIQNHIFYYGAAEYYNDDLANQIETEKEFNVASNIGLIQASDYIKANSNTSLCGTWQKREENDDICSSMNYMENLLTGYWTTTPTGKSENYQMYVAEVHSNGISYANPYQELGVVPSIYLKSDILLSGTGTEDDPYTITNY